MPTSPLNRVSGRRVVAAAAIAGLITPLLAACGGSGADKQSSLTIGYVVDPSWAQIPVAAAAGYFEEQSIDVKVLNFSTGVEALQALQGGQVDITTAADVPTASALPRSPELRVVADGSVWLGSAIVGNKSSGITEAGDLDGRQVATPIGTSAEYFATTVMDAADVDFELVQVAPSSMVTAMSRGDVEAVSIFQPYQQQVIEELGDDAVAIEPEGDIYRQHSLYLAQADGIESKTEAFQAFFAALNKAGKDLSAGDQDAIDAVAEVTNLSADLVKAVLEEFDFTLHLEPELAGILTEMAAWARARGNLGNEVQDVDYAPLLDDSTLPTS